MKNGNVERMSAREIQGQGDQQGDRHGEGKAGLVPLQGSALALTGQGEIYSYSTMYNVPKGFEEQKPYTIALVKLDDGPMLTAQLTDVEPDEVSIGLRVEMVTRKLREDGVEGQIVYSYKFRPLFTQSTPD
ncbi:MAG: Zn-ribbon domain-containing OB-fold protein [Litorilinea sp.]